MTYEEKLDKFNKYEYKFPVPPVTTQMWNKEDWIRWIDSRGIWK